MRSVLSLIACGCLAVSLWGQALQFEVAVIKPDPSLPIMILGPGVGNGRVTATKVTLKALVMAAYDLTAGRVIGPGWLEGDRFDVIAKAASEQTSKDDLRAMLQTLLKERFHLVAHTDTREMPIYELVMARGGVKMAKHGAPIPDGPHPGNKYEGVKNVATMGGSLTTEQIAYFLSNASGRQVVDKTGLDGKYDFFIRYMPGVEVEGGVPELGPPNLLTAVQEEMGLKLQPSKAVLSVVVVDQMDRMPTDN